MTQHDYRDLIHIFNKLFAEKWETVLVRGEDEPLYQPKDEHNNKHRIIFAHGYFSSALHEIAHWCVAGKRRRELVDFGYWYKPDGRTEQEQRLFEQVEVKPQALEWIFSTACQLKFNFSADNLDGDVGDMSKFKAAVREQACTYLANGLPKRAQLFAEALQEFYGAKDLKQAQFDLSPA